MKLFGKELFSFKKPAETMYDFAQHGLLDTYYGLENEVRSTARVAEEAPHEKKKKVKPVIRITPKGLYVMKALNDNQFTIKTDSAYIKEQLEVIQQKLDFLGKEPKTKRNRINGPEPMIMFEPGGVKFGRLELESMKEKLRNRLRIDEFKEVLEKYPHTTSLLIGEVVGKQQHLRCCKADEFVPDFPSEAIQSMKEYNDMCVKLFNKKSVFYVVADRGIFEQKNKRRDPILLAQSPFGHFWQILGAWDEEMAFLADL